MLPVTLQLTALATERKWESRVRMNIGSSRFPSTLDHGGYLPHRQETAADAPSGAGRAESVVVLSSLRGLATTTKSCSATFSHCIVVVQISSQPMKVRRQSLSHELTQI